MRRWRAVALFIILTCSLQLAGCGGGGGSSSPTASQTVAGVAAAGTPVSGTVYLEDSSVPAIKMSTQINTDGSYSLNATGLTAPFMLVAVGTVNGQSCTLYSLAGAPGVANINPLTNLAVFQAWQYAAAQSKTSNTDFYNQFTTVIPQIQTLLQQVLTQYGVAKTNFASDPYNANHSGFDLLFDMVAITVDMNYGSLAITNKMNGASILNTVLNGNALSGQINTANIPLVPDQTVGAVIVYPGNITIATGETASFKSIVVGNTNQAITLSIVETGGGDISTSGVFTAPAKAGKYHIKVTSASDTKNSNTIEVNVYSITEYAISGASSFVSGPDGNIWFTEGTSGPGNKIGRMTTTGVITEYAMPTAEGVPVAIISGPDGNLWFIESQSANKIGKITTSGRITEYVIPTQWSSSTNIISGPDGNLWFLETQWANKIGKITTDGVITEYAISPTATTPTYSGLTAMVSGPDGNLWFTEVSSNKIGKITTAGVITEYPLPTADSGLGAIVFGPDGNLWFTEWRGGKIGKITTAGIITEYAIPWSNGSPNSIISGPDGNLWFVDGFNEILGKITTAGVVTVVTQFPVSTRAIIPGPDGNIWFSGQTYKCVDTTCSNRDCVGKITPTGVVTEYYIPTDGLGAHGFISGPDGNLWFGDGSHKSIGVVRN